MRSNQKNEYENVYTTSMQFLNQPDPLMFDMWIEPKKAKAAIRYALQEYKRRYTNGGVNVPSCQFHELVAEKLTYVEHLGDLMPIGTRVYREPFDLPADRYDQEEKDEDYTLPLDSPVIKIPYRSQGDGVILPGKCKPYAEYMPGAQLGYITQPFNPHFEEVRCYVVAGKVLIHRFDRHERIVEWFLPGDNPEGVPSTEEFCKRVYDRINQLLESPEIFMRIDLVLENNTYKVNEIESWVCGKGGHFGDRTEKRGILKNFDLFDLKHLLMGVIRKKILEPDTDPILNLDAKRDFFTSTVDIHRFSLQQIAVRKAFKES